MGNIITLYAKVAGAIYTDKNCKKEANPSSYSSANIILLNENGKQVTPITNFIVSINSSTLEFSNENKTEYFSINFNLADTSSNPAQIDSKNTKEIEYICYINTNITSEIDLSNYKINLIIDENIDIKYEQKDNGDLILSYNTFDSENNLIVTTLKNYSSNQSNVKLNNNDFSYSPDSKSNDIELIDNTTLVDGNNLILGEYKIDNNSFIKNNRDLTFSASNNGNTKTITISNYFDDPETSEVEQIPTIKVEGKILVVNKNVIPTNLEDDKIGYAYFENKSLENGDITLVNGDKLTTTGYSLENYERIDDNLIIKYKNNDIEKTVTLTNYFNLPNNFNNIYIDNVLVDFSSKTIKYNLTTGTFDLKDYNYELVIEGSCEIKNATTNDLLKINETIKSYEKDGLNLKIKTKNNTIILDNYYSSDEKNSITQITDLTGSINLKNQTIIEVLEICSTKNNQIIEDLTTNSVLKFNSSAINITYTKYGNDLIINFEDNNIKNSITIKNEFSDLNPNIAHDGSCIPFKIQIGDNNTFNFSNNYIEKFAITNGIEISNYMSGDILDIQGTLSNFVKNGDNLTFFDNENKITLIDYFKIGNEENKFVKIGEKVLDVVCEGENKTQEQYYYNEIYDLSNYSSDLISLKDGDNLILNNVTLDSFIKNGDNLTIKTSNSKTIIIDDYFKTKPIIKIDEINLELASKGTIPQDNQYSYIEKYSITNEIEIYDFKKNDILDIQGTLSNFVKNGDNLTFFDNENKITLIDYFKIGNEENKFVKIGEKVLYTTKGIAPEGVYSYRELKYASKINELENGDDLVLDEGFSIKEDSFIKTSTKLTFKVSKIQNDDEKIEKEINIPNYFELDNITIKINENILKVSKTDIIDGYVYKETYELTSEIIENYKKGDNLNIKNPTDFIKLNNDLKFSATDNNNVLRSITLKNYFDNDGKIIGSININNELLELSLKGSNETDKYCYVEEYEIKDNLEISNYKTNDILLVSDNKNLANFIKDGNNLTFFDNKNKITLIDYFKEENNPKIKVNDEILVLNKANSLEDKENQAEFAYFEIQKLTNNDIIYLTSGDDLILDNGYKIDENSFIKTGNDLTFSVSKDENIKTIEIKDYFNSDNLKIKINDIDLSLTTKSSIETNKYCYVEQFDINSTTTLSNYKSGDIINANNPTNFIKNNNDLSFDVTINNQIQTVTLKDYFISSENQGVILEGKNLKNSLENYKCCEIFNANFEDNCSNITISPKENDLIKLEENIYAFSVEENNLIIITTNNKTLTVVDYKNNKATIKDLDNKEVSFNIEEKTLDKRGNFTANKYNRYENKNVVGNSSNNKIDLKAGTNVVNTKQGNDVIISGKGIDTMIFSDGDGYDVVKNANSGDRLVFMDKVEDIKKAGNDLLICHGNFQDNSDDIVVISNYFKRNNSDFLNIQGDIQNNNALTNETLKITGTKKVYGTFLNDEIDTTFNKKDKSGNIIEDYSINDRVFAANGDDIIKTGAGNDKIYTGIGNDIITAGRGDDIVYLENQNIGSRRNPNYNFYSKTVNISYLDGNDTIYGASEYTKTALNLIDNIDNHNFIQSGRDLKVVSNFDTNSTITTIKNYFDRAWNDYSSLVVSNDSDYFKLNGEEITISNLNVEGIYKKKNTFDNLNYNIATNINFIGGKSNDTFNITLDNSTKSYNVQGDKGKDTLNLKHNVEDLIFSYDKATDKFSVSLKKEKDSSSVILNDYIETINAQTKNIKGKIVNTNVRTYLNQIINNASNYLSTNYQADIYFDYNEKGQFVCADINIASQKFRYTYSKTGGNFVENLDI